MEIRIRDMTNMEFDIFCECSVSAQIQELMDLHALNFEDAQRLAKAEILQMLPDKMDTFGHTFFSIVSTEINEVVGYIWSVLDGTSGKKQNFICDFMIFEPYRRKGYGAAAFALVDQYALEAGFSENVLFVSDSNIPAQNLYRKCGYQFLRKFEYGQYWVKYLYEH